MEHIFTSNIKHHLDANFILSETQHGFCQNRSCETQLTSLLYDLIYTFDQRIQTDMVLLDFAKAFDIVPHRRLLYKLDWYGICENTHKWISTFLTNRTQSIVPSSCNVVSGVPQGTVLGPILFIIYINDLQDCIHHSTIQLFADNCIVYRPITSLNDTTLLQQDLDALYSWNETWLMRLNTSKYHAMNLTQARSHKVISSYKL